MAVYEAKVKAFHVTTGGTVDAGFSIGLLELRKNLLAEEMRELFDEIDAGVAELAQTGAVSRETKTRMLKEMADVQYVLSGMALSVVPAGVHFPLFWEACGKWFNSSRFRASISARMPMVFFPGPFQDAHADPCAIVSSLRQGVPFPVPCYPCERTCDALPLI